MSIAGNFNSHYCFYISETIIRYCQEAKEHHFASVCVNSCHVPLVAKELQGSDVKTCCVVGFPLGAMLTCAKAYEAKAAVECGAQEVDMVTNIGAAKDGNWGFGTGRHPGCRRGLLPCHRKSYHRDLSADR